MSIAVLADPDDNQSCLYDTVSMTAFGPVFEGSQVDDGANEFLAWYQTHSTWPDLRTLNDEQWRNLMDTYAMAAGDDDDDDGDDGDDDDDADSGDD